MLSQKTGSNQDRIRFLSWGIIIIALILSLRLFQKQVLEHKLYEAKANEQHLIRQELQAKRGTIYLEDFGKNQTSEKFPIAINIAKYSVPVVPKNIKDKNAAAEKISAILGAPKEEIFNKINNNRLYIPPLARRLEAAKADAINNLKLEGISAVPEETRFYPEGSLASHVLGFVNNEGDGKYGIEGYFNEQLKGYNGSLVAERDTKGRSINIGGETKPVDGSDLYLTIDHNIQFLAEQKLKEGIERYAADSGTIIVQNPKTGAILAMASWPTFDPNKFNEVPQDQMGVFLNPAIAKVWEPGSIFKTVAMSIALETKKVEPTTEGDFSNYVVVDGKEIHTAQDKAFGHETMTNVLENSDNVAMVWVMDKVGNDDFFKYLNEYNFGAKFGIEMDGETTGSVLRFRDWRNISRATMSFGQGVSVTPLQMVSALSAMANQGKLMKPYLVEAMIDSNGKDIATKPKEIRQVISPDAAKKIGEMMASVVMNGHGKKAQVAGFDYQIAGKTGTAQVPDDKGGYEESKHIGSFGGFFPVADPKIAMLVKFDNPKNTEWAESSAAPIFGEVASWLIKYLGIQPPKR